MKENKGITIVALVITIIVLIILAGVSINLLIGDNGLISKATEAGINMTNAQIEESDTLHNLQNKLLAVEERIGPNIKEYHNGVPIPKGFYYVGGEKDTGLVISDNRADENLGVGQSDITVSLTGNQYVWVPVKRDEFIRTEWSNNAATGNINEIWTEPYSGITEADETGEKAEYEEMKTSVLANGGFYVGRYEAGREARYDKTVLVQKDKLVYNYVPWGSDMTSIEDVEGIKGAVKLAREMYPESNTSYGVVSHLIYGVQWDSIVRFIADETYNVSDSTSWGNYQDSTGAAATDSGTLQETGKNEAWKAKNIYDIAGNAQEWTMEASKEWYRVIRGGCYEGNNPVTQRASGEPGVSTDHNSFRPVLYVKD